MDCHDKSDEMNCKKINVHETHLKSSPPSSTYPGPDKRLPLQIFIEIVNVLNLDEVHSSMSLQLKLTVEWIDDRLEYFDLKKNQSMNFLTLSEMDDIWIPTLLFTNTENKKLADFRTKSTFASIRINEGYDGLQNPYSAVNNGHSFEGKHW